MKKQWSYQDVSWRGKILRVGARILWPARMIRQSGLFDQEYYLHNNPDVARTGVDPLRHFLRHGGKEGRKPHPHFDPAAYLRAYPEVKRAGINPLLHYLLYGAQQGRESAFTDAPVDLERWIEQHEPTPAELAQQRCATFPDPPKISVITSICNPPKQFLIEMIESVLQQTYADWEWCIADDASNAPHHVQGVLAEYADRERRIKLVILQEPTGMAGALNAALALARGDFIVVLDHDDVFAPFALFEIARTIQAHPQVDFIYADEDNLDHKQTRGDPFFKPDWSPDTLRSYHYTGHGTVYRKTLLDTVGGFRDNVEGSQAYDLDLRITERAQHILHIPRILYHRRMLPERSPISGASTQAHAVTAAKKALQDHLQRIDASGQVTDGLFITSYHLTYEFSQTHKISILIPTHEHPDTLKTCLDSILAKSHYRNFEILLLENGSRSPETFRLYRDLSQNPQVKLLIWERPFHYAALNNFGAAQTAGDMLLFLNNDVEVIAPDWLERVLEHAARKEVGAVGAKLYYPDDTVQHAGVTVGPGKIVAHRYKYFPRDAYGLRGRLLLTQNVSAVTAACMMIRKDVFEEVSGFDERYAVTFNDVDICLKIRAKGYWIVWTPYAELYHHESQTRGYDDTPEQRRRARREAMTFYDTWQHVLEQGDPYA